MKITDAKREEIKQALRGVSVADICRQLHKKGKISSARAATVWEVLRGDSENFNTLLEVVKEAKRRKQAAAKKLANL